MGLFSKLFGHSAESQTDDSTHHLLMLTIDLAGGEFGSKEELKLIRGLEEELGKAVESSGVGEYDGDAFGDNEVEIYLYGPSADDLLTTVKPILARFPKKPIRVYQQYGPAEDKNAKEKRSVVA